jgi:hypothetical protein
MDAPITVINCWRCGKQLSLLHDGMIEPHWKPLIKFVAMICDECRFELIKKWGD